MGTAIHAPKAGVARRRLGYLARVAMTFRGLGKKLQLAAERISGWGLRGVYDRFERRRSKSPLGDISFGQRVAHGIADQAIDCFWQNNGRARLAHGIAERREFHASRASGSAHHTDAMKLNHNAVDVDFDGGESKVPTGTNRRDREDSNRDTTDLRVKVAHAEPLRR